MQLRSAQEGTTNTAAKSMENGTSNTLSLSAPITISTNDDSHSHNNLGCSSEDSIIKRCEEDETKG